MKKFVKFEFSIWPGLMMKLLLTPTSGLRL